MGNLYYRKINYLHINGNKYYRTTTGHKKFRHFEH